MKKSYLGWALTPIVLFATVLLFLGRGYSDVYEIEPLSEAQFNEIKVLVKEAIHGRAKVAIYGIDQTDLTIKRSVGLFDKQEVMILSYSTKVYQVSFDKELITATIPIGDNIIMNMPTYQDAGNVIISLRLALGKERGLSETQIKQFKNWVNPPKPTLKAAPMPDLPPAPSPRLPPLFPQKSTVQDTIRIT